MRYKFFITVAILSCQKYYHLGKLINCFALTETIKKPDTDLLMKYNACSRESSTETQTEPVLQREITDKPSDLPETVEPKPQTHEQEIPIEPQQSTNYSFVLPSTAEPPQEFSIQPEVIVIKGVIAQQEVSNSSSGHLKICFMPPPWWKGHSVLPLFYYIF